MAFSSIAFLLFRNGDPAEAKIAWAQASLLVCLLVHLQDLMNSDPSLFGLFQRQHIHTPSRGMWLIFSCKSAGL
jgi:hypothetical protein